MVHLRSLTKACWLSIPLLLLVALSAHGDLGTMGETSSPTTAPGPTDMVTAYSDSGNNLTGWQLRYADPSIAGFTTDGTEITCSPNNNGWDSLPTLASGNFVIECDIWTNTIEGDFHFIIADDTTNTGLNVVISSPYDNEAYIGVAAASEMNSYLGFFYPQGSLGGGEVSSLPSATWTHVSISRIGNMLIVNCGGQTVSVDLSSTHLSSLLRMGIGYYLPGGNNVSLKFRNIKVLQAVEMAGDSDRNGAIVLANENPSGYDPNNRPVDVTSESVPYRFWLNNDDDGNPGDNGFGADNPTDPLPDNTQSFITNARDLEDWSRLWLYTGAGLNSALQSGQIRVGLKWKQVVAGNGVPSIRLVTAASSDGGLEYLQDKSSSFAQAGADPNYPLNNAGLVRLLIPDDQAGILTIAPTAKAADFIFPTWVWKRLTPSSLESHFLFEGCSSGLGQLEMVFLSPDGKTVLGSGGSFWLNLMDIKNMYERYQVNLNGSTEASAEPIPYQSLSSEPSVNTLHNIAINDGFVPIRDPNEEKTYIVFVHGYNMPYPTTINFAETMYKRLWWCGYEGRFAVFRWPTVGNGSTFFGGAIGTYNDDEYRAWNSGNALQECLSSLPSDFRTDVIAHSMGNYVVGSALEQEFANGIAMPRYYIMLHSATTASAYDTYNSSFPSNISNNPTLYSQIGETFWPSYESNIASPETDTGTLTKLLEYRSRFGDIGSNNTSVINFYDNDDWVTGPAWNLNNNQFKPQGLTIDPQFYFYNAASMDGHRLGLGEYDVNDHLQVLRFVDLPFEGTAYVDHSLTGAISHYPQVAGSISSTVDETASIDQVTNTLSHDHSAEWNGSIQECLPTYKEIMSQLNEQSITFP